jgi:nucleotide-binding universal stress UspA family protein
MSEAAAIAAKFDAEVIVASVVPNLCFLEVPLDCASVSQVYRAETEGILEAIKGQMESQGIRGRTVILEGSPADAILDYARDEVVDLIVVGSTGKHATARTLFGSVSSKIATNATRSVLVVR